MITSTEDEKEKDDELSICYKSLRLPRGLIADLEEVIIFQDRQFLTEVGQHLGLSRPEIATLIRRVLGTGAEQSIPVLWGPIEIPEKCPWWDCHGENLWRKCSRYRISPSLPCVVHERSVPCPLSRPDSDPFLSNLPYCISVTHKGRVFWVSESPHICLNEDGTAPQDGLIMFINRFCKEKGGNESIPVFITMENWLKLKQKQKSLSDRTECH